MDHTACGKCKNKACVNKIESPWQDQNGNVHIIQDCAPKRTMLMIQGLHNAMIGLQKSQESLRNEIHLLRTFFEGWKPDEDDDDEDDDDEIDGGSIVKEFYIDFPRDN